MSLGLLRLLEHLHGHLGWLTVAVLVHPAILLRPRRSESASSPVRRCDLAVILALACVTISAALGDLLYPEYRARIRPHLFADAPSVAWLFERKEHLAFGALLLSWAAGSAYLAARRSTDESRGAFGRAAFVGFGLAAAMAMVVAAFGVTVAVEHTF